jgi:hypothetical protein
LDWLAGLRNNAILFLGGIVMEFVKLNIGWDAEPNAPMPKIEFDKSTYKIILSFYLNAFIHDDVDKDDIGILEFSNCYKYRLGATNDEGFYRGQCRFSKSGKQWGDFYRILNSNWRYEFPSDEVIIDNELKDNKDLCHFLFYFRDETFECIALTYKFTIRAKT